MSIDFVTVATYWNAAEAELARAVLEGEGIHACLEGEATARWMWYWANALGGIKVQVPASEAQRAREILQRKPPADSKRGAPQRCGECGAEVEPGFDTCWSCGAEIPVPEDTSEAAAAPSKADDESEDAEEMLEGADAALVRAFRAAIIGTLFCPGLLHAYSIYWLLHVEPAEIERARMWQYYLTWIVNLLFLGTITLFVFSP